MGKTKRAKLRDGAMRSGCVKAGKRKEGFRMRVRFECKGFGRIRIERVGLDGRELESRGINFTSTAIPLTDITQFVTCILFGGISGLVRDPFVSPQ